MNNSKRNTVRVEETYIEDLGEHQSPRKSKSLKYSDEKDTSEEVRTDAKKKMNWKLQNVVNLILDNLDSQNVLAYQSCMEQYYPKENNMSKSKKDALYVLRFCGVFVTIFIEYKLKYKNIPEDLTFEHFNYTTDTDLKYRMMKKIKMFISTISNWFYRNPLEDEEEVLKLKRVFKSLYNRSENPELGEEFPKFDINYNKFKDVKDLITYYTLCSFLNLAATNQVVKYNTKYQ